ncbi:MAG TPA: serine hydrolase domain-containing protein [Thermoanaerobaculia bacterium]
MKIARTLIAFLLAAGALAQVPGEDRIHAFVRAYNTGNAEQFEAFVQKNYTPEALKRRTPAERRAMYEQIHGAHGKLEIGTIRATGNGLQASMRDERGQELRFRFNIEPAAPHRLAGFGVDVGGGNDEGPQLPPLQLPKGDYAAALDAYIRNLPDFSGVVLVARDGQPQFEKAYGMASRRYEVPNKTTTRFNVGSITKDFTKVAIGQLAQAGKLKLDAPIATYLPDYPNKDVASKITVQQLVDHRSGLGDIFTPRYWERNAAQFRTLKSYIDFFASDPLHFEPGKGQRYSNYGYTVLGAIVEAVSGESYFDYVRKHVFEPAGMSGSGFFAPQEIVRDLAMGHTMRGANGPLSQAAENTNLRAPIPAGGSQSTARDLLAFDRALRAGKLLDAERTRWWYRGEPTGPWVGAGGSPGVNAVIASDKEWTVVVLTNIDPQTGEKFGEALYEALK